MPVRAFCARESVGDAEFAHFRIGRLAGQAVSMDAHKPVSRGNPQEPCPVLGDADDGGAKPIGEFEIDANGPP